MALILSLGALLGGPVGAEPDWDRAGAEALDLLRQYIRFATVNPPADTTRSAAWLEAVLTREGIPVERFASAPDKVNLLARLPGRSREGALLMLHHQDVVPADASRWPLDPFAADLKDGFVWGRGSMDMKSVGVMQILTMIYLRREHVPLEHDLLLLATCDEESGGEFGARWMLEHHPDRVKAAYLLDEGGFGTRDLLSARGTLVFGVSVAEKRILWGRLVAEGTSGHGSQPVVDNANDRLLLALSRLGPFMAARATRPGGLVARLRESVGELADNKFTRAIQGDTVSLTSLRSGVGDPPKVNVIPSRAEATLDFRLLPDADMEAFMRDLAALWRDIPQVSFETLYASGSSPISPADTPLFRSLEAALKAEYPQAVVTPYLVPFGTDSNSFRQRGALAYGFGSAVVDASIVASMHSDSERLPLDQLTPSFRVYYRAVRGYVAGAP